ncbi:N-acylneuraminate-9-phosphatase [Boleophthalmus pectinirostris]|uniref:N-acylneuraminate-9-phosphatase n=1 Tax=Boleophthalmus pectinirostris TaxID=150288 RepID=UPI000A1C3B35|nr:N-acylneuraminate-9-phosphatase [Boleophthalmus pectinirostris]XP_055018478.1 N-acylneuraminate-9-phosphatase [Boleophthalmus pectinirostris]
MENKGVKAIIFDLDNTLIDTHGAGEVALLKVGEFLKSSLNLDDASTETICSRFKQKLYHEVFNPLSGKTIDQLRSQHWEESVRETVGSCPGESFGSDCYRLWKSSRLQLLTMSPEVQALLVHLRTRYKLLLLTNGVTQTQREKVEVSNSEEFFDEVVVGGEHEEQKPSVLIFRMCFEMLGVEAQDCVMVGDSLDTDIQGGLKANVRATVWIKRPGSSESESIKPHFTISNVLELPRVLAQLN